MGTYSEGKENQMMNVELRNWKVGVGGFVNLGTTLVSREEKQLHIYQFDLR